MKSWTESKLLSSTVLCCWLCLIYVFSAQANSNALTEEYFGDYNFFVRKGAHMAEYAVLCLVAYWCFKNWRKSAASLSEESTGRAALLTAFVFAVFYAATDEWHQSFVPGRSAALSDILIDACGALMVVSILQLQRFLRKNK